MGHASTRTAAIGQFDCARAKVRSWPQAEVWQVMQSRSPHPRCSPPLTHYEHLGGRKARSSGIARRRGKQDRIDLDPVPLAKFTHECTDAKPVAPRSPCQGARLTLHGDGPEVPPVILRVLARRRVGMPICEQVHGNDAFALGFGGAAMGHRSILGVFRLTH